MIVGLVGLIGSGKDTAADFLVENYNFQRESFAGHLKDIVSIVFGWDRNL
jgi:dephospho-CoA kinase